LASDRMRFTAGLRALYFDSILSQVLTKNTVPARKRTLLEFDEDWFWFLLNCIVSDGLSSDVR
jgi:hypothetical protein